MTNDEGSPLEGDEALAEGMSLFVEGLNGAYARYASVDTREPRRRRQVAAAVRAPWSKGGPEMHRTLDRFVDTPLGPVAVRIHLPHDKPSYPVLVYLHGGGWVMFGLDTHDRLMREYAARAGCAVVGVDYSLSPEARFPDAVREIAAITVDLARSEASEWPFQRSRLLLGGDSAGAQLALASAMVLRDAGRIDAVSGLLLNYGAFDPSCESASYERFEDGRYLLGREEMRSFWAAYAGFPSDYDNPLFALLKANLRGLPPSYLVAAELDVLLDDSRRMKVALSRAGVDSTLKVYPGVVHSFLEAVSTTPMADRALDDAAAWLRQKMY